MWVEKDQNANQKSENSYCVRATGLKIMLWIILKEGSCFCIFPSLLFPFLPPKKNGQCIPLRHPSLLESMCCAESLRCVWLFKTPWTVARQAPLSMGFSRQEHWSGLPCPPPGDLPDPGIEPRSQLLLRDSLRSEPPGKPTLESMECL